MERERPEDVYRLMRAIRSLAYNRELQPLVKGRIERAESSLRGHLLANGLATTRVGPYKVEMDGEGGISLTRLPIDDWKQLKLTKIASSLGEDGKYIDAQYNSDETARVHPKPLQENNT